MWRIAFVLPNIIIGNCIETEYLALVEYDDERIVQIKKDQPYTLKLLDGFLDDFNKSINPSVMIYKEGFPENVVSIDSMVSYRNIIAISTILPNWSIDYSEVSPRRPLFSNNFDFYPITLTTDGSLITSNPALESFYSKNAPFIATPSREVPRVEIGFSDPIIFEPLIQLWKTKYETGQDEDFITRKIFRSLEMAFYALSIPTKNESSVYDFGLIISLWISAIEILVNPVDNYVNKFIVLDMLSNHGFKDSDLNKGFSEMVRNKKQVEINFIQKLYLEVYNYRSKFIHGDVIDPKIIKFFKGFQKLSLLNIGPNLYRLILYLVLKENNLIKIIETDHYLDGFIERKINIQYKQYFLNVLNSSDKTDNPEN